MGRGRLEVEHGGLRHGAALHLDGTWKGRGFLVGNKTGGKARSKLRVTLLFGRLTGNLQQFPPRGMLVSTCDRSTADRRESSKTEGEEVSLEKVWKTKTRNSCRGAMAMGVESQETGKPGSFW